MNDQIRKFEGTIEAASPAFSGMKAPARLMLIDRGDRYECHFVFKAGVPIFIELTAMKNGNSIEGTAEDPRGWDVSFTARLAGDRVTGTYHQPHDHGTFDLKEVQKN